MSGLGLGFGLGGLAWFGFNIDETLFFSRNWAIRSVKLVGLVIRHTIKRIF